MYLEATKSSPLLRQLLIGLNVRQKTKGPVQIFLRTSLLPVEGIHIFLDGIDISNNQIALKRLTSTLSKQWSPGVCGNSSVRADVDEVRLVA